MSPRWQPRAIKAGQPKPKGPRELKPCPKCYEPMRPVKGGWECPKHGTVPA